MAVSSQTTKSLQFLHASLVQILIFAFEAVTFCARNVPYLSGRVLVQVSLRHLNDREAIIKHCHSFAKAFEEVGVPRDRFAIKLPFSGSAASAALQLNAEGIRTLATAVFSVEQAIAASQSNCLFISPYYNGKKRWNLHIHVL
jgi:transaldolase